MSAEPVVQLRGVNAGYQGSPVVRDIDLTVRAGEMVGLFGTNGAGKTTTLLTIAGEVPVLSGELLIRGRAHPGTLFSVAKRERVALLTDDRGIFAPLTVRDNLRLGRGSVEAALEFFPELREHLDRKAGLLSGGQQQMLALGRIFASEPSLILADELSLGLAPIIVKRLVTALRAAADAGAAVLLVEQHVPVALGAVDRACVIVRGEIALQDDAENLRSAPERIVDLYLSA